MEKKKKLTINLLIASIGVLIALIPGLSQLSKIKMLPDYWDNGDLIIGVVSSVLSFVVVLILYSYREEFAKDTRKKIIRQTIALFCFFLFSIIAFCSLSKFCVIKDDNEHAVFVPILLSDSVNKKIDDPQIKDRFNWVKLDYAENVKEEIDISTNGQLWLGVTMVIFVILYLSIFVLLIATTLVMGFHLTPTIQLTDKVKPESPTI